MVGSDKLMLGFIVRRCIREIGHVPTAEEFAAWANGREEDGWRYSLFGKAISAAEARVLLRHPARLVTVRPDSAVKSPAR